MRIEITERNGKDLAKVDETLDEFFNAVEQDYEESLKRAKGSLKARAMGISGAISGSMPEFIQHIHFVEGSKVIARNNLPFNRMAKTAGSYKKMEKGLEGFLHAKGFDCYVRILKDLKEDGG